MFGDRFEQPGNPLPDSLLLHCPQWTKDRLQQRETPKSHRVKKKKKETFVYKKCVSTAVLASLHGDLSPMVYLVFGADSLTSYLL